MIKQQKVLALIPARGGSKGVPNKNIQPLNGKPLIAWTIEAALRSVYIDRVVVSSENSDILRISREWGADTPFVRPSELARDDSSSMDVVYHALKVLPNYEWLVLLQPTSPLRLEQDIDCCLQACLTDRAPACVSVSLSKPPEWLFRLQADSRLNPVLGWPQQTRRQQLEPAYAVNGMVYVAQSAWFLENRRFLTEQTIAEIIPAHRAIDIDSWDDFQLCAGLLNQR
jgi:CMP-N,N'-diacetyllegionaminic acid synthase